MLSVRSMAIKTTQLLFHIDQREIKLSHYYVATMLSDKDIELVSKTNL